MHLFRRKWPLVYEVEFSEAVGVVSSGRTQDRTHTTISFPESQETERVLNYLSREKWIEKASDTHRVCEESGVPPMGGVKSNILQESHCR